MKLSDWCILVTAIGICCILPLDIQMSYVSRAFCLQKSYDRVLDRICEDSLMDAVEAEYGQGEMQVDVSKVYERFEELLSLEFGTVSEWEKEKLLRSVRLEQFEYLDSKLSVQQTEELRQAWEAAIAMKSQTGEKEFSLYFPFLSGEDWYQNPAGPSFYSFFDPEGEEAVPGGYRRYVFSGGRIVKQVPEGGYGAVQSGSSIQKKP